MLLVQYNGLFLPFIQCFMTKNKYTDRIVMDLLTPTMESIIMEKSWNFIFHCVGTLLAAGPEIKTD